MKLQVAIDRVELEAAVSLAKKLNGKVDIIEMGTSLIKDYGMKGMQELKKVLPNSELLIDLKTIDEGQYEFKQGYKYGGDILTVMGASSIETLRACYEVSLELEKTMMIDLLEVDDVKINHLQEFETAIFCLHYSIDKKNNWNAVASVEEFHQKFPKIQRLAIAGGIDLEQTNLLKKQQLLEIVIVGSNISKSEFPEKTAKLFMEALKK